jgi:hypothetical protein
MSSPGARAANRFNRSLQSEPLVFRMHKSEFSAAIVARPSGWLTSTFRIAICKDTHNSTPQRENALNVVLPGGAVYGAVKRADGGMGINRHSRVELAVTGCQTGAPAFHTIPIGTGINKQVGRCGHPTGGGKIAT